MKPSSPVDGIPYMSAGLLARNNRGIRTILRVLLPLLIFAGACGDPPIPKPTGYYRITFPEKNYLPLQDGFPYRFEIPGYSKVVPVISDSGEPGWINIQVPGNKAEIHISYKKVENNLAVYTEESRRLAYDHSVKASSIEEKNFINPSERVFGTIYTIQGNAASPMQFYLTDSTRHFLRGSLYIRATPNIDSLKPVIDFLKSDVIRLIETLEWTTPER